MGKKAWEDVLISDTNNVLGKKIIKTIGVRFEIRDEYLNYNGTAVIFKDEGLLLNLIMNPYAFTSS